MAKIKAKTANMIKSLLDEEGPFPADHQVKKLKGTVDEFEVYRVFVSRDGTTYELAVIHADGDRVWLHEDSRAQIEDYQELLATTPSPTPHTQLTDQERYWQWVYFAAEKHLPGVFLDYEVSPLESVSPVKIMLEITVLDARMCKRRFKVAAVESKAIQRAVNKRLTDIDRRDLIILLCPQYKNLHMIAQDLANAVRRRTK